MSDCNTQTRGYHNDLPQVQTPHRERTSKMTKVRKRRYFTSNFVAKIKLHTSLEVGFGTMMLSACSIKSWEIGHPRRRKTRSVLRNIFLNTFLVHVPLKHRVYFLGRKPGYSMKAPILAAVRELCCLSGNMRRPGQGRKLTSKSPLIFLSPQLLLTAESVVTSMQSRLRMIPSDTRCLPVLSSCLEYR